MYLAFFSFSIFRGNMLLKNSYSQISRATGLSLSWSQLCSHLHCSYHSGDVATCFHPSDNYQISSLECQELPAVRRLQCDSRSRWVSPGAREMTGWNSAQSRPFRAESCEATCICCNSCPCWTCWTQQPPPSQFPCAVCLKWRQEHQGTKQTGLDIRKYFITWKVSQSWNTSLKQLYKSHPWMLLGFIWMKPEVLILNWCLSFFEWKGYMTSWGHFHSKASVKCTLGVL